jgi:hypothetical protein
MIFFAELKLSTFLISSGAAFQSLVDEPIKLVSDRQTGRQTTDRKQTTDIHTFLR